jgi:UDP-N-acetyl-D-mannosaminuronic acid dehydrogenase
MRICVIGLGHVGLPTALLFAQAGITVLGCDTDAARLAALAAGRVPIREPGLDPLLHAALDAGRLLLSATPGPADAHLVAVPTPITPARQPDLTLVAAAIDALAPALAPGALVVLESTCPVGTTEAMAARLRALRPDLAGGIDLAYCPERVLPGAALAEIVANDRVVGGLTPAAGVRAAALYARVVRGACHVTDARAAEFVKLLENAFRDVNIAFANEAAGLARHLGVDARAAIALANRHPRVAILNPGPGVGGHCIPVDPWFLAAASPDATPLIQAARAVNDARPGAVLAEILAAAPPGAPIAVLGLAYKPGVGDLRESPALAIARGLAERAYPLLVAEPYLAALPDGLPGAVLCGAEAAVAGAGVVAVLVAHTGFRGIGPALAGKRVIDAVGLFG